MPSTKSSSDLAPVPPTTRLAELVVGLSSELPYNECVALVGQMFRRFDKKVTTVDTELEIIGGWFEHRQPDPASRPSFIVGDERKHP